MSEFRKRWEAFADWAARRDRGAERSSMWQQLIADFDIRRDPARADAGDGPGRWRGYGLFARRLETTGFRLKARSLEVTYWFARAAAAARGWLWQANVNGLGIDHLACHPAGLRWLKRLGLFDEWRRFCDRFELSLHSAAGIKACYVASLLAPHLAGRPQPRLIEVGGGFGNVAAQAHFRNPLFQYVVVDLPEMMLHSSRALQQYYPAVPCRFLHPGSPDAYDYQRAGFYFCPPEAVAQLAEGAFDAGCNIDSFQEMTEPQVAGYLALLQRVVMNGGHLVTLNRRKYLEAERFDNNPLLYPYGRDNVVKRWETDLFMDRVFNFDHIRLDGWLLRVEEVRKSDPPA